MPRNYPAFTVAFGVDKPDSFSTILGVHDYLNRRFETHGRGCFSIDGPHGQWAGWMPLEIWQDYGRDEEKLLAMYEMFADGPCGDWE